MQQKKIRDKYAWTRHAEFKMRQYRLSPSLIKRVIRYPKRHEEGIVPNTIAVMRPAQSKKYSEVWAMYVLVNKKADGTKKRFKQIKIITAWRYPGKSPERDPIPAEIIREARSILGV